MGIIEKAFQNDVRNRQRRESASAQTAQTGNLQMVPSRDSDQMQRQFDLDYDQLEAQGFFVGAEGNKRLAKELRLLKRRLLRRTGYLRNRGSQALLTRRARQPRNLIMVTSTRPNEGKTYISSNLALSLALEDQIEVLLVDGDALRPKVQSHFGIEERFGFCNLIGDPSQSPTPLTVRARNTSLSVMGEGGCQGRPSELFASAGLEQALHRLAVQQSDRLIIVDAPPVLATTEAVLMAPFVHEVIFVVEADRTPEQAISTAIDEILDVNANVSLVLNKCLIGGGGSHYDSYAEYYSGRPSDAKRG